MLHERTWTCYFIIYGLLDLEQEDLIDVHFIGPI